MSSFKTGQQRHLQDKTATLLSLIAAAWVFSTPPGVIAQESTGNSVPTPQGNGAHATGHVEVTFVDPFGISEASNLQIDALDPNPVNVDPDSDEGGTKTAFEGGAHVPASLTVTAAPRQSISILVDEIVPGSGYSLSDFRCKYDARSDTACDGPGYSEMSVANGTLTGDGTRVADGVDGSFAVTISYQ
jgi:hypothetical protein